MNDLSQELVRELLDYDPDSGHLKWRSRGPDKFPADRHCRTWNTKNAGKRAGTTHTNPKTGYTLRQITILGKRRYEHQVVWVYVHGHPLPNEIDHANQDATDNRLENIRSSDHRMNSRNRTCQVNNTSGVTGVYWHKRSRKWCAQCEYEGSHNYLGLYSDIRLAEMAVKNFRNMNGFDEKHGKHAAWYR